MDSLDTKLQRKDGTTLVLGHSEVTKTAMSALDEPRRSEASDCPLISSLLSSIGGQWSVLVMMLLRNGSRRFGGLQRKIGGISQRMLTLTLRSLERNGLVARTVYSTAPQVCGPRFRWLKLTGAALHASE